MEAKSSSSLRTVLVTGGTGFIGSNLVRRLLREGSRVHLVVRPSSSRRNLEEVSPLIRWHEVTGEPAPWLLGLLEQTHPDAVFHLAGSSFNHPPTTDLFEHAQVNIQGTLNLLEALKRAVPEARFVFAGSAAEYGAGTGLREDQLPCPATLLGGTKAAATNLIQMCARLYGLRAAVVRIFTPFGPHEQPKRLIPHTILSALRGEEVLLTDGRQGRDFLYIDDLLEGMLLAACADLPPGEVINVCSGISTTVVEIVRTILELMGTPVGFKAGALPTRKDEIWEVSGSRLKAKELLGWEPRTPLPEGLSRTIDWWKARAEAGAVHV